MDSGERVVMLCKGRYPAGLFSFDEGLWNDEGVKQAADTGADFFIAKSSEQLITLCGKYSLGIISSSNITPFWWGGDGKNAGDYAKQFPLERLDKVDNYPSSSVLWGDYLVDEPNSKDFAHIGKVIQRYRQRFPDKIPFINLYPNYGRIHGNSDEEIVAQLGNTTYPEHIDQYVRSIDLPYICFDYYPFTGAFDTYLENLDIAAKAGKKSNKEMWVIIQAGAWKRDEILDAYQIDWQVYMCLAYGAKAIIFASYSKTWWDETSSCVNTRGEKNKTYEYVSDICSVLHSELGTEFLKYQYQYTRVYGDVSSADKRIQPQLDKQNNYLIPPDLPNVKITSDRAVIAGFFRNNESHDNDRHGNDRHALMIVNTHNPFDSSITANVKIETGRSKEICIHGGKKIIASVRSVNGNTVAELIIPGGQGVFVSLF